MRTTSILSALTVLASWSSLAQVTNPPPLVAGPLTLEIHVSRVAHWFHAVDQIAQWSEFCHRQYVDWFEGQEGGLSGEDRQLLQQHAALRKQHGWGGGLEQTFYTCLDLEPALAHGIQAGWLTEAEAATERRVLTHFASRVDRLMIQEAPALARFAEGLTRRQSDLDRMATMLARFAGCTNLTVAVYPIASPGGGGGGGFNGQRLTLEIGGNAQFYATVQHELFHAFLAPRRSLLEQAARGVPGLDAETLSEGLAYAFNPGLDAADPSDRLAGQASRYLSKLEPLKEAYPRFTLYGLALRPLLKSALADPLATVETFLPRATDAWLVLTEIDQARRAKDPSPGFYVFGLWDQESMNCLRTSLPGLNAWGWLHQAQYYTLMLNKHAKPGEHLLLLFSLDDPAGRVPEEYSDLLPAPWADIEGRLRHGHIVTLESKARQMRVFLLAAPTKEKLRSEFRRLVAQKELPLLKATTL